MSYPITHPFVRPGQVAPDLPAPDNCVQCGKPEAAHISPELRARITAAKKAIADSIAEEDRWLNDASGREPMPDWQSVALHLRAELTAMLSVLGERA